MSDQVCTSADQHPDERDPAPAPAPAHGWASEGDRMIAVTAELIAGRYLPAIPTDSEDRSRD
jgi:hypothetical protein